MKSSWNLSFFTWDSPHNPWLGGGGTRRDQEMLVRFCQQMKSTRLFVGSYPGAKAYQIDKIDVIPLGLGTNEWISRLSYILLSNLLILILALQSKSILGLTMSPYSMFWTARLHPRHFGVLHHTILDQWKKKIGTFLGGLFATIEASYYRQISKIVIINSDVEQWVRQHAPRSKVFASANACDQDLLEIEDRPDTANPYFLFFGRIDRFMKGTDLLLQAWAQIKTQHPTLSLKICGRMASDLDRKELHQSIQDLQLSQQVQVIENPSETDKRELLSGALFFVSPSRFEGWGIAALEACAAGKALVVSEASGFLSSVKPGQCALLVPIGDIQALANAMQELLVNDKLRMELAARSRPWARQFNWDSIAQKELNWIMGHWSKRI